MTHVLKILTYNIAANYPGYGDYARIDKIREVLLEGNWDIIGLNEVYNKTLRKILLGDVRIREKYPFIAFNLSDYEDLPLHVFDNGLVILSKYAINKIHRYEYQNKIDTLINKIFSPKDLLYVEIDFEGTLIDVFFTHLQWGDTIKQIEVRKQHFGELKDAINNLGNKSKPTIIFGDMNIYGYYDRSDEYLTLKNQLSEFIDWHHILNPNDPAVTWSPDNVKVFKWFSGERFDYIFSSTHFTPIKSNIHQYKARIGPYIMKWRPINSISSLERIRIEIKRVIRLLHLPLVILFNLFMSIYRIKEGYPPTIFVFHRDLSDHYALEGVAKLNE